MRRHSQECRRQAAVRAHGPTLDDFVASGVDDLASFRVAEFALFHPALQVEDVMEQLGLRPREFAEEVLQRLVLAEVLVRGGPRWTYSLTHDQGRRDAFARHYLEADASGALRYILDGLALCSLRRARRRRGREWPRADIAPY